MSVLFRELGGHDSVVLFLWFLFMTFPIPTTIIQATFVIILFHALTLTISFPDGSNPRRTVRNALGVRCFTGFEAA